MKKWILIESETKSDLFDQFASRSSWRGFSFYVVGDADPLVLSRLTEITGTTALPLGKEMRESARNPVHAYHALIAELNRHNRHPFWYSIDLATRNPLNNRFLLLRSCLISHLDELQKRSSPGIILANLSPATLRAIADWLKKEGESFEIVYSQWKTPIRFSKRFARFYKRGSKFVMNGFRSRFEMWRLDLLKTRPVNDEELIVRSYVFGNDVHDGVFKDTYFGVLLQAMSAEARSYRQFVHLYNRSSKTLKELSKARKTQPLEIVDAYLRWHDYFRVILRAHWFFIYSLWTISRLDPKLNGHSIRALMIEDFLENFSLGGWLYECLHRDAGRRFFRRNCRNTFLYPFENISWERIFVGGARSIQKDAQLIGFQHASLTPLSLMTYLTPDESKFIPMPTRILTTGPTASRILSKYFHYPAEMLETAAALRQKPAILSNRAPFLNSSKLDILVPMSSMRDAEGVLSFLKQAEINDPRIHKIRLRFHPLLKAELLGMLEQMHFPLGPLWQIDPYGSLEESAAAASLIAYSASTAAIECIMRFGTPALYLDIDDVILNDPLFELQSLKRVVKSPKNLETAILDFAKLDDANYRREATDAFHYLNDYFSPPTEQALKKFFLPD